MAEENRKYVSKLQKDGFDVRHLADYFKADGIPDHLSNEMKQFLEGQGQIVSLDDQYYWHGDVFQEAVKSMHMIGNRFRV